MICNLWLSSRRSSKKKNRDVNDDKRMNAFEVGLGFWDHGFRLLSGAKPYNPKPFPWTVTHECIPRIGARMARVQRCDSLIRSDHSFLVFK